VLLGEELNGFDRGRKGKPGVGRNVVSL